MRKYEKFGGRVMDAGDRNCDWPDCRGVGEFRAPKNDHSASLIENSDAEGSSGADPLWLCLDHVREYNSGWDFFAGMSDADVDAYQKDDPTWHRPTWPFTGNININGSRGGFTGRTDDPLDIFERAEKMSASDGAATFSRALTGRDREALKTLGLDVRATPNDIKASFKALAKGLHPDLNGGNRAEEERLRRVIEAYNYLSDAFAD